MNQLIRCCSLLAATALAMPAMALQIIQPPQGEITNPLSAFVITVDGQFSPANEWSDVTPRAFQGGDPPVPKPLGTGDTLVYGALAKGTSVPGSSAELYLMYEYKGRTNPLFTNGQEIGTVSFPVTLDGTKHALKVIVRSKGDHDFTGAHDQSSSFFDVFFQLDNGAPTTASCPISPTGTQAVSALCGIEAGVGFNASPFGALHLMIELEVPLLTPANFFTNPQLTKGALNGVYSPAPAFWGAAATDNAGDPPISSALFMLTPNGGTDICPVPGPCSFSVNAPLPGSLWLLSLGLAGLGLGRRMRA